MMDLSRVIPRLLFLALVVPIMMSRGEVYLTLQSGATFESLSAYSPQLGGILHFSPRNGPTFWIGDLCSKSVNQNDFPPNSILVYYGFSCDPSVPLIKLAPLENITAIIELFGTEQAIVQLTTLDPNPYDVPPRFAFDINLARKTLYHTRVHGSDSGKLARFLKEGNLTANATVVFLQDPWKLMFYTPQYLIYEIIIVSFFCFYVEQHAIRSLYWIHHMKQKSILKSSASLDLRTMMMCLALLLGFVRMCEYSLEITRDYFDTWVPEVAPQLV